MSSLVSFVQLASFNLLACFISSHIVSFIVFNGNMASLSLLRNLLSPRNGGGQDGATDHTSSAGPGDRPVSEEAVLINASPSGPGDSPLEEAVLEDMSPPGPGDRPSEEADMLKNLVNVGNGGQDDSKPVAKASQEEVEAPPSPGVRPSRKIMTAEEKLGQIQDDLSNFLYVYDQFVNCLHPSDVGKRVKQTVAQDLDCSDPTDVQKGWNVARDLAVLFRNTEHTQLDDDVWDDVFMKLGHAVKTVDDVEGEIRKNLSADMLGMKKLLRLIEVQMWMRMFV